MRKIYKIFSFALLSFLIAHCTLKVDNCEAQWVPTVFDIPVLTFIINGSVIFAGTYSDGVYVSTNDGTTWTQTSLNNMIVYAFAISGSNIFAGTDGYGVYLSTNNGMNWTQTALNDVYINSLAVNGSNIFAGTDAYGIYISTNNGTNWTQTSLNNKTIYSLVVSGSNIFAGAINTGVYISTNNGTNWTQTALNNKTVSTLAVIGSNIFAGTYSSSNPSGIYLTTNNGTNWTQTTLSDKNILSIAVSGTNIIAGTFQSGIYHSVNNGTNWVQRNEGFITIPSVDALLITNNYIFAAIGNAQSVWRRFSSEIITEIQNENNKVSNKFSLLQNYPNPFNPNTNIKYNIPENGKRKIENDIVTLKIFNILGKEVVTLVNKKQSPGTYEVTFDGSNFSSGIYFYKMEAGDFSEVKKMILMK